MKTKLSAEILTICDHALTSKEGKLSIIGIFDRIFTRELPARYGRFFVVAVIKGEPSSEHEVALQLLSPSAKAVLPKKNLKLKFGPNGKANIITDIASMAFEEVGEHQVELFVEDKSLATSPLFITKLSPQQAQLPN